MYSKDVKDTLKILCDDSKFPIGRVGCGVSPVTKKQFDEHFRKILNSNDPCKPEAIKDFIACLSESRKYTIRRVYQNG